MGLGGTFYESICAQRIGSKLWYLRTLRKLIWNRHKRGLQDHLMNTRRLAWLPFLIYKLFFRLQGFLILLAPNSTTKSRNMDPHFSPPTLVNQWVLRKAGSFAGLKLESAHVPNVSDFDVLVKIHAASLNYRDLMIAKVQLSFHLYVERNSSH